MRSLKVRIYKGGKEQPKSVITIPLAVARLARQLIPRPLKEDLERKGIALDDLLEVIQGEKVTGTLIEIEKENERIVIAVE